MDYTFISHQEASIKKVLFFISSDSSPPKPICVICQAMLSNKAMKPSKLCRNLETKCAHLKDKSDDFFKRKHDELATQTKVLKSNLTDNEKLTKASYILSHHIAKCQEPFMIGEKLVFPLSVLGLRSDIKMQITERAKASDWFAIQLDESTDISNLTTLLVYIRYVHEGRFHEGFLFCKELPGTTTAGEIFYVLDGYITGHRLLWGCCVGVCTDGAAAMTGRHNRVISRVKAVSPSVQAIHCIIHREVLAFKCLSTKLHEVLNQVLQFMNFIITNPTNSCLFTARCEEMGADNVHLLLHSKVRSLSRRKVMSRVYELRREIEVFLTNKQFRGQLFMQGPAVKDQHNTDLQHEWRISFAVVHFVLWCGNNFTNCADLKSSPNPIGLPGLSGSLQLPMLLCGSWVKGQHLRTWGVYQDAYLTILVFLPISFFLYNNSSSNTVNSIIVNDGKKKGIHIYIHVRADIRSRGSIHYCAIQSMWCWSVSGCVTCRALNRFKERKRKTKTNDIEQEQKQKQNQF
uniref:DUF4371 domain-containing protein n=1 Tax=Paramormyrops kingsleyae TaxID=1676925 RepID=A0A3B3Q4L9_9TELE